jgi:hypothetical protein
MRRYGTQYLATLLFLTTTGFAGVAFAEVYKWVDAQGNIHFGDKPRDAELAEQAESVDIVESYQPQVRNSKDVFENEQEALRRRTQLYRQEDEEKRKQEKDKRKEQKAALCAAYKQDIAKLTTIEMVNGRPTSFHLEDENGESVSSQRQLEIVEELKKEYAAAGCK